MKEAWPGGHPRALLTGAGRATVLVGAATTATLPQTPSNAGAVDPAPTNAAWCNNVRRLSRVSVSCGLLDCKQLQIAVARRALASRAHVRCACFILKINGLI